MNKTEYSKAMRAAVEGEAAVTSNGKRWICDVWCSAEELLEAAKMGIVELSRCDLPGGYDVTKCEASKLEYMGAEFHFVRMR